MMSRNLDLAALRAFVTVAEAGGVTRAAVRLHLTQSAVSMQLKRLEEQLGQPLLDRSGRSVALTARGEELLGYGKRLLELNDDIWARMTERSFTGEIALGVPHDIVYPHIPEVLHGFHSAFPSVRLRLDSSLTRVLKQRLAAGELDVILTTEEALEPGGETLGTARLVWVGAPGGTAWRARPLRLAFETACIFRGPILARLEAAGIPWEMSVSSDNTRSIEATVAADLAVCVALESNLAPHVERIRHGGALPELPGFLINQYMASARVTEPMKALAAMIRQVYRTPAAATRAAQ